MMRHSRPIAVLFATTSMGVALGLACVPDYAIAPGEPPPESGADATSIDAPPESAPQDEAAVDSGADADASSFDAAMMIHIPEGGPVPIQGGAVQVTLTHAFKMDKYEVDVGRFSRWVAAGRPAPCNTGTCDVETFPPYAGKMRWDASWNAHLAEVHYDDPANCGVANNTTSYRQPTYTMNAPLLPMNCVNWYQALAFCAFEKKRLPTEVEWEYVASGRGLQRVYPWGAQAPTDCSQSIWFHNEATHVGCGWPVPVGSAPAGAAHETILDMAGSVYEWVWDWDGPLPATATDYTGIVDASANSGRGTRGGSFASSLFDLQTNARDNTAPNGAYPDVGFRCVATLP